MSLRKSVRFLLFISWTVAVLPALSSCGRDAAPRVVLAEFLDDKTPNGKATQGERIRVTLDRPLPPDYPINRLTILTSPQARWQPKIARFESGSRVLEVEIASGEPAFQIDGVFRLNDPSSKSTGLGFDLGDGRGPQWVDLQWMQTYPVLKRVEWQDSSRIGGDHVVNEGDQLRLFFDRPVRLEVTEENATVEKSDVRLRSGDRLDDGTQRAQYQNATTNEVVITLGAKPLLSPDAGDRTRRGRSRNGHSPEPSVFALNGTPILPFERIVDPRNSLGAVSMEVLPIEHPMKPSREMTPAVRNEFPPPGNRVFHTVTPFVGGQAVVIGGAAVADGQAIGQVLVFDPAYQTETVPFSGQADLSQPRFWHTATRLPGLDGVPNSLDDVIVVAGGYDGERYLNDISIVRVAPDGSLEARSLLARLRVGRARHAAAALHPSQIVIDGGETHGGQVGCAEVLTVELNDTGEVRVTDHRVFRSIPRRDHTLTALGQADQRVLAFGGFGGARLLQYRRNELPVDFGAPIQQSGPVPENVVVAGSRVLTMPIVINVDNPTTSFKVRYAYRPALSRYGHRAIRIRDAATGGGETVVIAGGTTRHPVHGYERNTRYWDIPLRLATTQRPPIPDGHEAGHAILFSFFEDTPAASRLEVVDHPNPDPTRVAEHLHPSVVAIPQLGVLLTGGEQPTSPSHPTVSGAPDLWRSSGGQLYLAATGGWHPLSFWLRTSRSRHQSYYSGGNVYLIGGISTESDAAEFSAVEVLPVGE